MASLCGQSRQPAQWLASGLPAPGIEGPLSWGGAPRGAELEAGQKGPLLPSYYPLYGCSLIIVLSVHTRIYLPEFPKNVSQ